MSAAVADAAAPSEVQRDRSSDWLIRLLGLSQLALLLVTKLWLPADHFPQVPLIALVTSRPQWADAADLTFFGLLLAATCALLITTLRFEDRGRRGSHAGCAVCLALLFVLNQHRLQPWAWQFFVLHAWLALSSPTQTLTGWRWLTISIYAYSALSKFDYAFCTNHGPFLLDGFLYAGGFADLAYWPANMKFVAALAMPCAELSAAVCLCFPRTQRLGLVLSWWMHLFLIIALGPWGHNHTAGVLIWNAFFLAQNGLLFAMPVRLNERLRMGLVLSPRPRFGGEGQGEGASASNVLQSIQSPKTAEAEVAPQHCQTKSVPLSLTLSPGAGARGPDANQIAAWLLLAFALLAPLGEPFGWWDHWPSWAVYAARPERVTVLIHEDEFDRLPAELQQYVQPPAPLESWLPVRLDRWSLDATHAPIYPQSRFHVGVALAVAERCELTTLKLTIDSPPNRWTGRRDRTELLGLDAIRAHAATYRCNALPR